MATKIPGNALFLGYTADGRAIELGPDGRSRHLYVVGATRSGKSKFLENCIRQDIKSWPKWKCGLIFADPHGSTYHDLVRWLAWNADLVKDHPIILIDPSQPWVVGYDLLRRRPSAETAVVISSLVECIAHGVGQANTVETPLFGQVATNILWALYELNLTLAEAVYFTDFYNERMRAAMVAKVTKPEVRTAWENAPTTLPRFQDEIGSTVRRLRDFLSNDRVKLMFGQQEASLDWDKALYDGAIVLVNLSQEKAKLSERQGSLLGATLLEGLWLAAQQRGKKKNARPSYVFIDEFQRFVSPVMASGLAEAAGYGLHMTLAHQFPSQLLAEEPHGKGVFDNILGNAQNMVVFRTRHPGDRRMLAEMLYSGVLDPDKKQLMIESTKVLGYSEETRIDRSQSVAHGHTRGAQSTTNANRGTSGSTTYDQDGNLIGSVDGDSDQTGTAEGESEQWSKVTTAGTTTKHVFVPRMGKETSSVQFESLENQLHRAGVEVSYQEQRQFVCLLHDHKTPVSGTTPVVKDVPASEERVESYIKSVMSQLPISLTIPEAQKNLADRQEKLEEQFLAQGSSEPATARRTVAAAALPPPPAQKIKPERKGAKEPPSK